jgi:cadmium resistance transport/sequestration family protein
MEVILASIVAFATTNIDDIFILTLFFGNRSYRPAHIVSGQFIGIITLIAIAFAGSFIGLVIDLKYIGLLGIVPLYIGVKSALRLKNSKEESESVDKFENSRAGFYQSLLVAGVTIANGGDNISIYIPLFATLTFSDKIVMISIFLIMTALWCFIANYLSGHPAIKRSVEKYGHIATPFIFILLGIYIMYESGTFDLVADLFS